MKGSQAYKYSTNWLPPCSVYGGGQVYPPHHMTNVCKTPRLWGAIFPLVFNKLPSNLTRVLIKGALSSGVDRFSLTCPCQRLKKKTPWNGLLEAMSYQLIIFHFVTNLSAWFDSQLNMHNLYNKIQFIKNLLTVYFDLFCSFFFSFYYIYVFCYKYVVKKWIFD